jgi:hypothetical protein
MYDRVVTINNTHWLAYRKPGATLVDLRMFDPNDRSANPRLVFGPRSCASWEYRTRSSRPLQNLIRRDSFYSTTCRIRWSQQPAMRINTQPTNPQLEPGGGSCPKSRILAS